MNSRGKVLIIDDEASLRRTLTRILQRAGCEVSSAGDGNEALQMLSVDGYDLVYLDIHLPLKNGLEVLQDIRSLDPRLPVILLTAYGSLQTAMEALRLGASDYLLKPLNPEVLVKRTQTILKERAIERRKVEIQAQILALQAELEALELEIDPPLATAPELALNGGDRFLKRGGLNLDLPAQQAVWQNKPLSLPPTAFDYLVVLSRHSPNIVDYQTLVMEAQGYEASYQEAKELSKYHIHVLRQELEQNPQQPEHVINVRGSGYRLLLE